ncbi:MAG: flavodoxin family protein, partial [Dehalococcoidia bacterium]|nr:flavodoxin family protein [Dehalococcoidia bacterium]
MKVVAFNGSPRGDSNTAILIRHVFAELKKEGIETETFSLSGKPLLGCLGCYKCYTNHNRQCVQTKDALNTYVDKMIQADGIILASP